MSAKDPLTSKTSLTLCEVLRGGRQCDEDGTDIIMSRQACCVAADELERLESLKASAEEAIKARDDKIVALEKHVGNMQNTIAMLEARTGGTVQRDRLPPAEAQEYESVGWQYRVHSSWGGSVWSDSAEGHGGSPAIQSRELFVKRPAPTKSALPWCDRCSSWHSDATPHADEKEAPLVTGCHRSHPHENMDAECERLTVIARENNQRAHEKSPATGPGETFEPFCEKHADSDHFQSECPDETTASRESGMAVSQILARCRMACGGKWPEELTSGVMFYEGERITRAEFETQAPLEEDDGACPSCGAMLGHSASCGEDGESESEKSAP